MRILVTGVSGSIGSALHPRLTRDGHELRGLSRDPRRVDAPLEVLRGDAASGAGLDAALDGVECVYYLIHSMEGAAAEFDATELRAAQNVVAAARRRGVARVVYLGGLVPTDKPLSRHLRSRLAVEQTLLEGFAEAVALRASIVIGARSRSFRFLVRLVERVPVMPLPAWRVHRTQPIDGRDVTEMLAASATTPHARGGLSLDVCGPDVVTYAQMMERIRDALLLGRPRIDVPLTMTPVAARFAARVAGEDVGLIQPLMESLESDLLPRDDRAAGLLGVRLRRLDAAVERALREWESTEELAAR